MTLRKQLSKSDLLGLFTVVLIVNYRPLTYWLLHFDGAGRIPTFFCVVSFILLFTKIRHFIFSKPFVFYLLLALFQYVNGLIKGSVQNYDNDGIYLLTTHIFLPFVSLLLLYNAARKNFDYTLKVCVWGLFVYSLICFLFGGVLLNIKRTDYAINANEISLYCAISVGLFLFGYIRRVIHWHVLPFVLIPLICVIVTASRMGIGMIAIMFTGFWVASIHNNRRSLKSIISGIVILIIIVVGLIFILNNTESGERLSSTTEQTEYGTTGTILDFYGDRGVQYFLSWPYFLEHPITGIGIGNWIIYNPLDLVCHSEYLVQYLEGGLISFILYCLFWIGMFKRLNSSKRNKLDIKSNKSRLLLLAILMSIVFANTVLWTYDMYCIFIVYALVLGFAKQDRKYTYSPAFNNDKICKE